MGLCKRTSEQAAAKLSRLLPNKQPSKKVKSVASSAPTLILLLLASFVLIQSDVQAETLVEKICADRLSGVNTTIPGCGQWGDKAACAARVALADSVICPSDVDTIDLVPNNTISGLPDLSGVYFQNAPGEYAWIGTGKVTLSLELVDTIVNTNLDLPAQEYKGAIVFENFYLVSDKIPDVLPWRWRTIATDTYSGTVSGTVTWDLQPGVKASDLRSDISSDATCGIGGVFSVTISPYITSDGSVQIGLQKTTSEGLPSCPDDECFGFENIIPDCRGTAEGIFPSPIYGAPKPYSIYSLTGAIKGQAIPHDSLVFLEEIGVQRATVYVIKQPGYVKTTPYAGESDQSFYERIAQLDLLPPITNDPITIESNGRFSFDDLPLFETVIMGGKTSIVPAYYTIRVANAQSEAEVVVTDPDTQEEVTKMETSYFENNAIRNIRADRTLPMTEHPVVLNLLTPVDTKLAIANKLSAPPTENNYKSLEQEVITHINGMLERPSGLTDKELEGLKRGVLSEFTVQSGAYFADGLLDVMLKGVGAVMADAWDEFFSHRAKAKSSANRKMKKIESDMPKINLSDWDLDPDVRNNTRKMQSHLDHFKLRNAEADFIDGVMINSIKMLSWLIQTGLERAETFEAGTPKKIAKKIEETLIIALKSIKGGALNGFSRGSVAKGGLVKVAKFAIPGVVSAAKPILLDNTVVTSYTGITAPLLQHSVDKVIKWNDEGPEPNVTEYRLDQEVVSTVLDRINNQATRDIINAQYALGFGKGFDSAEAVAGALGTIPPLKWVKVLEKGLKVAKFLSNGAAAYVPMITVYKTIPNYVKEGVYRAFGEEPPDRIPELRTANQQGKSETRLYVTQSNARLSSAVSVSGEKFSDLVNQLSDNLKADNIGAALELTGGESADNYINQLSEFNQAVSVFMTQAQGADQNMMTLLNEQVEFRLLEAELGDRITDLYVQIMTSGYENPKDILYIAERDKIVAVIDSLTSKMGHFEKSLEDMNAAIADMDIMPAIVVQGASLVSDETGENTVTLSPEVFTLRARVRNVSNVSVSGVSAEVTVNSARESITTSPEDPIEIGAVAADDGAVGTGPDEIDIEWKITYEGDLSTEVMFISIDVLENGEQASNFVTKGMLSVLTIDPSVDDKDLDLMPDSYEATNGLDATRDDAMEDKDKDGLTNYAELVEIGTDPQNPDTDGDGLSDGEEATGGVDGYVTDPFSMDTDDDGVPDNSDGQPVDGGTSEKPETEDIAGEPEVSVDKNEVTITTDEPMTKINVMNSGTGTLSWAVVSDNDAIVIVSPSARDLRNGDGVVLIAAPTSFDFDAAGTLETTVRVIDLAGATHDIQSITVVVQGDGELEPPTDDNSNNNGNGSDNTNDNSGCTGGGICGAGACGLMELVLAGMVCLRIRSRRRRCCAISTRKSIRE